MKLINEYLIIIDKESKGAFYSLCNNGKRFNEFVSNDKSLEIKENKILNGNYACKYSIKSGEVNGKFQRFFGSVQ